MRAILLDLDDTLLDDQYASSQALTAFIDANKAMLPDLNQADLFRHWREVSKKYWQQFERGELSFLEQRRQRVQAFLGQELSGQAADDAFLPYLITYENSWRCFPEVADFFALTKDIPKVIITNGDREQQQYKTKKMNLDFHVNAVITPMDCNYWKPAHGIFQFALDRLGVKAADAAMIGDCLIRDIRPAQELGMRTFQIEPHHPGKNLISALEELGLIT
ncbi:HAD family hydrolase [Iodobacter sp. LRB]|uniref:HAD family hydrolase n=1 Tax=unclassified Iodobacter TaxID=235634 RepID=UPI0015D4AB4A|nr:HAD family hydrolase [Iodobacter sp. BJB302]